MKYTHALPTYSQDITYTKAIALIWDTKKILRTFFKTYHIIISK